MTVFTSAALLALIANPACGNVPASSELAQHLVATALTESGGDQYAIGVNSNPARGLPAAKVTSTTAGEAVAKASALIAQGRNIDLGLMQINLHQLDRHHLTLRMAFDECSNVAAGAQHLADDYRTVWNLAHRFYNCGRTDCGEAYAQIVTAKLGAVSAADSAPPVPAPPPPCAPAWDAWALATCQAHSKENSQ